MPGTTLAGQWVTVTAPPGVNIYTQMDRACRMSWQKAAVHAHTHTQTQQWNTDQQHVVHQWHKRENYGLVWSGVSKGKKWHSVIWAAKLWHRLIWLLLDERHFRKPVFQDFREKKGGGGFSNSWPGTFFIFCHRLKISFVVLGLSLLYPQDVHLQFNKGKKMMITKNWAALWLMLNKRLSSHIQYNKGITAPLCQMHPNPNPIVFMMCRHTENHIMAVSFYQNASVHLGWSSPLHGFLLFNDGKPKRTETYLLLSQHDTHGETVGSFSNTWAYS